MEKEKLESLLIEYIDGKLNSTDRGIVEKELVNNQEAFILYEQLKEVMQVIDKSAGLEPSINLRASFDQMLKEEMAATKTAKTIFFSPMIYRVAAAVTLVVLGVAGGMFISNYQDQQRRLAEIEKQLQETKNTMRALMENPQSASQRIQGVNVAMTIEKADDDVVKALMVALNEDPNTNVRLAALDALSKFQDDPKIRRELIAALNKQKDPVVQIALIQLMVKMKEKNVIKDLQRIIDDSGTINAVKDEAYTGIVRLS